MRRLRQLAAESLVYGLAGAATSLIGVITVPIYTRVFSPADYGTISLVTSGMALIAIFVVLALDNSVHRWYWDTEDLQDRKRSLASWFWCQLVISSLAAGLLVAAAPGIVAAVRAGTDATSYFRLAALALPFMTFTRVANGWLRLQRRAVATAIFALTLASVTAGASVTFVTALDLGIRGLFLGQLFAYSILSVVALALLRDWINPTWFSIQRLREMLRFALPLVPAAVSLWVVNLLDRYFLNLYASKRELGLYQVGYQLSTIVALATGAFQQAYGPFAMSLQRDEDASETYAQVLLAYVWFASFGSAAVTVFSPEILRVFTTPAYYGAHTVVGFLSFSYVLIGLMYIAALGPSLARTTKPIAIAITFAAGSTILLNFALTPQLGKEGAAIATLVSWMVVPLYLFRRSQELHRIPYRFGAASAIFFLGMSVAAGGSQLPATGQGALMKLGLLTLLLPGLFIFRILDAPSRRTA